MYIQNYVHIFAKNQKTMQIVTITSFRANAKRYFDSVINDNQEVIVSRGADSVAIIPIDEYNAIKETEYLMSSKEMERAILQGMDDARDGNYREVDVDAL